MKGFGRGLTVAVVGLAVVLTASADGRVTGTTHQVKGVLDFEGVACPPKGSCIAVGETPRSSHNESTGLFATISSRGRSGSPHKVDGTSVLTAVACPEANVCFAVGSVFNSGPQHAVFVKIDHGQAGQAHSLKMDGAASIGCGSRTSCWVPGEEFPTSGGSVAAPKVVHLVNGKVDKVFSPNGSYSFSAGEAAGATPACFSATSCILAGRSGFQQNSTGLVFSLNRGKVKVTHRVAGTSGLAGLDCTSKSYCTLVGFKAEGESEQGEVTTLSSGKVGRVRTVKNLGLFPLACSAADACFSFGGRFANGKSESFLVPINHGKPGNPQQIDTFIRAATCRRTHCLGVGEVGSFPNEKGTVFSFTG
ncbi:MAG: hypothetical protein ACJ764_04780 [Solirubrobacteraceae bacterium]